MKQRDETLNGIEWNRMEIMELNGIEWEKEDEVENKKANMKERIGGER